MSRFKGPLKQFSLKMSAKSVGYYVEWSQFAFQHIFIGNPTSDLQTLRILETV